MPVPAHNFTTVLKKKKKEDGSGTKKFLYNGNTDPSAVHIRIQAPSGSGIHLRSVQQLTRNKTVAD
jgi:hypothetical protein